MNIDVINKTIILKHSLIEKILAQTGMYNLFTSFFDPKKSFTSFFLYLLEQSLIEIY